VPAHPQPSASTMGRAEATVVAVDRTARTASRLGMLALLVTWEELTQASSSVIFILVKKENLPIFLYTLGVYLRLLTLPLWYDFHAAN